MLLLLALEMVQLMEKNRKNPLQRRSQILFESVIDSATRILPALGYARTTTNRIATRAGISIGSLYQYFPHKDAIFATLLERELNKHLEEVAKIVRDEEHRPLEEVIEILVEKVFSLYIGQRELSRELFTHVSRLNQVSQVLYVRNLVIDVVSQLLTKRHNLDPELAKRKVFIGLNALMGIIQTCTLVDTLPMSEVDLKKELSCLLKRYFC